MNPVESISYPQLHIANANFVTKFLAVGGDLAYNPEKAAAQAAELVAVGITNIIDVREECHDTKLWSRVPAVSYLWNGIDDIGQRVPAWWFEKITAWADDAINCGGVVLTHCHMGINRGPSAGYAVLLRRGWDPVRALAAIREARPIAAIAYAEDALDWHLDRIDATPLQRADILLRVERWRRDNPLDVKRIIRNMRQEEKLDMDSVIS